MEHIMAYPCIIPLPVSIPPCLSRFQHGPESNSQHYIWGPDPFQFLKIAGKPCDPPEHHLRGFLPSQALCGCRLHRLLPVNLPGVHGGQRGGVFHRAAQQEHAHGHQPVYSQPRHQWPAGWHLLHANHAGGQHHNRSEYLFFLILFQVYVSFIICLNWCWVMKGEIN